ncbi:MAG: flagellar hook-length control protein FliK [Candidatus Adiutrix sp.]|nr:flagellar hook-length control protein FliK [Candidatus Adiutrix sp.]
MDLANLLKSAPIGDLSLTGETAFSRPVADGEAFAEALSAAQKKISGHRDLVQTVLTNKNLTNNVSNSLTNNNPLKNSRASGLASAILPKKNRAAANALMQNAAVAKGLKGLKAAKNAMPFTRIPLDTTRPAGITPQGLGQAVEARGPLALGQAAMTSSPMAVAMPAPQQVAAEVADSAFSFKRGWTGAAEMVEMAVAQNSANSPAQADLPQSYKKQVGVGLMVMGQDGLSADSMLAGASLMNSHSPAEALRDVFSSLGAAREHLKLDKAALNDLGQVLADSGVSNEEIDSFISGAAGSGFSIKDMYARLEKLDLSKSPKRGLDITPESLAALGQFLSGVGVKPEAIDELTSQFQLGEKITAADLRPVLTAEGGGPLAPCLTETDARNLESMLKSMGVSEGDLDRMSAMLGQGKGQSRGQASTGDVLSFLEGLENTPAKAVTGAEMKLVKNILDNIAREQELVKAPVFEETLVKLQALGDQDIDEDFARMSPALQALRGGVSGLNRQDTAFGGQGEQNGQHSGQNGQPGQGGQQQDGRDSKEQFRHNMAAVNNEAAPAAAAETVAAAQSYGGPSQESLARQISQKIAYSHRKGVHRLKMNLNPADMGRLDIELKVQGDQLVAHIRAQNRETYEALSGEIESLKTALAEGGVEISNLTLAFDDQENGHTEFADLKSLQEQAEKNQPSSENTSAAHQGAVYRVI